MAGKRRILIAGVAILVVSIVVAVLVARGGSSNRDAGSHLGFPAPDADDADADREYLDGKGRVLLVMHERAQALAGAELTAERCRQEAEALDRDAGADQVLSRIGGLTDPVLRDAFHAERTALGVALTRCINGKAADDRAPELAEAVEAVDVRLHELGE